MTRDKCHSGGTGQWSALRKLTQSLCDFLLAGDRAGTLLMQLERHLPEQIIAKLLGVRPE